jgi:hypothetical protein
VISAARAALGEEAFAAAWMQGQAMSPEDAIRHFFQEDGEPR